MPKPKIILAGGSGFLGRTLARWLASRSYEVVVLTRQTTEKSPYARYLPWDARTVGPWAAELESSFAVINLAGRSVDCRYTHQNRREIIESRVFSTQVLGLAIAGCVAPPPVWLNSSTATIYQHTYAAPHDETGVIAADPTVHDAFSIAVAQAWEKAFHESEVPKTRKIILRTAMVFGREAGGVYSVLRRLTRLGLGGKMASGKQYVSWLHEQDFCRAIEWLMHHSQAQGIYNLCAPEPVINAEMMRLMRASLGRSIGLPASRIMLELGAFFLRTETELILKSRRVIPQRLLLEDFEFNFREMREALDDLAGQR